MKTLVLLTMVLIIASVSIAQNVNIPDEKFKSILLNKGIDTDRDDEISFSEAEAVTRLELRERDIPDITGIEAFINLEALDCMYNKLTSLNVSMNTALISLDCSNNHLTSLDISKNTLLEELRCSGNQLTSLDVSMNTALRVLWCSENQLTNLNISENINLVDYDPEWPPGGYAIGLDLSYLPTLYEVCVWEMPFPPDYLTVDTTGSSNAYFTTDCSATALNSYEDEMGVSIFPNPSDDIINIDIGNPDNAIIEIYTISGSLLYKNELARTSHQIDLSSFPKGVYFITIRSKEHVITRKIIKM